MVSEKVEKNNNNKSRMLYIEKKRIWKGEDAEIYSAVKEAGKGGHVARRYAKSKYRGRGKLWIRT